MFINVGPAVSAEAEDAADADAHCPVALDLCCFIRKFAIGECDPYRSVSFGVVKPMR